MKISLARNSGFCFGVKKALEEVEKIKNKYCVYILGQLIHNKQVINELKKKGIKIIDDVDSIGKGTVVISAHGIPDKLKKKIKEKNLKIIYTTCPLVEKVHNITKELEKQGYNMIIFGDREHTEVKGIAGNLNAPVIINNASGISAFNKKYALVSQTTQDQEEFGRTAKELRKRIKELKVMDTICSATKQRQNEAKKLAKKVDMMLVIGDFSSANTRRLEQICLKIVETRHIETASELKAGWFKGKAHIGITAGASTPDWIIKGAIERIKNEFQ